MPNYYSIIEVKPEWMLDQESMGSKEKFWYRNPEAEPPTNFLFKYPRPGSGEHWSEKIAAEVARCLDIDRANVELAIFQGAPGSATESFTQNRLGLLHGNQLLELTVQGYDPERRYRQTFHTLENIWQMLDQAFAEPDDVRNAKLRFAEYLILDAVIGNTDRHHENWGLLYRRTEVDLWVRLAPSFDHASSLGRELSDTRRDRVLTEGRVGAYSERAPGGIYWSADDRNGPSPLELVRRAVRVYPDYFRPGLLKLEMLTENNIMEIVNRIPADWMTDSQRFFAVALMQYNLEQLSELT